MNNKLIKITMGVGLSAAMLLGSVSGVSQVEPQTVQAARSYKIKLNHKAVVYSARGQRKGALKNGRTVTAYGVKKIHGKRYYSLGAGKYIKVATATKVGKATQPAQNTATASEQPAANTESSSASSKSGLMSLNNSKLKEEAAEALLDEFIYHDQASNWAHRKSLLSKANKTIGVDFAFEAKPGMATQGNKYPDYLGDHIAVDLQTH